MSAAVAAAVSKASDARLMESVRGAGAIVRLEAGVFGRIGAEHAQRAGTLIAIHVEELLLREQKALGFRVPRLNPRCAGASLF